MKKKIALDLDGVVFDSENLFRVYSEIYDTDVNKKDSLIDNSQRTFQKRYSWSEEESKIFYNKYAEKIIRDSNLMPGADIVLNKLKDKYEFIVVTSRNDLERDIALLKFAEFGFINIKVFNNEHHKIDRYVEEKVDIVIDDDPIICSNAADEGICSLFFKNNASNKVEKTGVINVNNWGEIYKYLMLKESSEE